jgi:hypothetical protein
MTELARVFSMVHRAMPVEYNQAAAKPLAFESPTRPDRMERRLSGADNGGKGTDNGGEGTGNGGKG